MSNEDPLQKLLTLLERLAEARLHYRLSRFRADALAIEVAVPGERWEIEFFADGTIDIERFRSDGKIEGEELLDELFKNF